MVLVVVFVAVLLVYTLWRFNAKRHPVARLTSHHVGLEVAWTLIPALMLMAIAVPTFSLIYYADRTRDADLTIKVTGHQWYWEYGYPDQGNLHFDSYILPQDQLKPGQLRLLDVDNQLVLPVGENIRILATSADVIHSFFVPSLGVQRYAIPGHLIETWVRIDTPGVYYGECNQICGTNHSQMPIAIHAVPPAQFKAWLVQAKQKFSANEKHSGTELASIQH
jgi:cytochrome c oxidase subunit 2